ncbi:MAG: hypothetical protein NT059_09720 [Planctomycetota bacterium]|nr:hypothetical protein [Planctomycetota bacterium]
MPLFRRALSSRLLAVLMAVVGVAARPAIAQCNDAAAACTTAANSNWLGDLNADNLVNQADIDVWSSCMLGQPVYCISGDFNFDGAIDNVDRNYLGQLVAMASSAAIGKLPKATLSEVRVRKPNDQTDPTIPQSRYVEIRVPTTAVGVASAPTVNDPVPLTTSMRAFQSGWFYVKIARSNNSTGTDQISGTVAVVESLQGMPWDANPLDTNSRGLGVLADSSFTGDVLDAVPVTLEPYIFYSSTSLAFPTGSAANGRVFPAESATNVTHLIVFRNPNPANTREYPTVGQRVNVPTGTDPTQSCDLAWTVPGALTLPPWDAIVDALTIVRGTEQNVYGCIFADNGKAYIGPVGNPSNSFAPPHIYRCRNAGNLTKGPTAITPTSDTPFVRNPSCTANVTGCGEPNQDGTTRSCFEPQSGPSCSDSDCCNAVCNIDPGCCNVVWDQNCAAQATVTCVGCGSTTASCYQPHQTPSCSDPNCCSRVCAIDPTCCDMQWNSNCVTLATANCLTCGVGGSGACDTVHSLPYCDDSTCCTTVCNLNPYCCTTSWDQSCVDTQAAACQGCGAVNTGPCCIAHSTPYCSNSLCCAAVCALDPFCCTHSWDISCTQIALVTPSCSSESCACGGDLNSGEETSCFIAHTRIGCADSFCCQTVCMRDPYCCYVTWDAACVAIANDLCSSQPGCIDPNTSLPVNGSCYIAHPTAVGCDKPGCCSQVCADPSFAYCCQVGWDAACALKAVEICDQCGDPLSGSCYSPHASPNCADGTCCASVCNIDPFCCEGQWDSLCVSTANVSCISPISVCGSSNSSLRSCWIPNYTRGCSDGACCTAICRDIDPYCCEARWDAVCAHEAVYMCTPTFVVTIGREGCLTAHASTGCANAECSRAVCSVDPSCCTTAWDQGCVLVATAVCPAPESCPAVGDCFASHSSPGCHDSSCCNGVCAADPSCCQGEWDSTCVTSARTLCKVPANSGWTCPCHGGCFEAHDNPGCDDGSCCSIVCNISPSCCDADWDSACVSIAREYCCGAIGCGSGCNKPCLIPHQEPYCNDPYCCDAVCRNDPLCCSASWDALCAAGALARCGSSCGLPESGDCFIEHDLPGCSRGECCSKVCVADPSCCTIAWDFACVNLASLPANATNCKRPVCGDFDAGPSCEPHPGQSSNDPVCCAAVCAEDTYCCNTEWDADCVDIARTITSCGCSYVCGDVCAGNCCRAHDNGACNDAACCASVCAQDAYCCNTLWDSVCAGVARDTCTAKDEACPVPPCGSDLLQSCCVPSIIPNCSDQSCCTRVCLIDSFCCDTAWDVTCVNLAAADPSCGCDSNSCGDASTGSCLQVHATPFCNEIGCCQTVCAFQPSCCDVQWDANCVATAQFFCGSGNFTGLLDAYRGGPIGNTGRGQPPAGWIPARERGAMRHPKPIPPSVPMPKRPPVEAKPIPRSDGVLVQPVPGKLMDAEAKQPAEMQTGKFGANAGKPASSK